MTHPLVEFFSPCVSLLLVYFNKSDITEGKLLALLFLTSPAATIPHSNSFTLVCALMDFVFMECLPQSPCTLFPVGFDQFELRTREQSVGEKSTGIDSFVLYLLPRSL